MAIAPRVPFVRRLEVRVAAGACALVAAALIAVTWLAANEVRRRAVERATADMDTARTIFESLIQTRAEFAASSARVFVSAQPYFRALLYNVSTDVERQTLAGMAADYTRGLNASFTVLSDQNGRWVGTPGWPDHEPPSDRVKQDITEALAGRSTHDIVTIGHGLFLVVTEPARFAEETLGTVTVGYPLDDALATDLARVTHSDVNFVADGRLTGSSLSPSARAELASRVSAGAPDTWSAAAPPVEPLGPNRYLTRVFPLVAGAPAPQLVLLRDWKETQDFIDRLRSRLMLAGLGLFAAGIGLAIVFARSTSRPLAELSEAAADIASGNWTRRVRVHGSGEAQATARAFNEMTASLQHYYDDARDKGQKLFQSQKMEAMGRLAGGIAHDFNNLLTAIQGYGEEVQHHFQPGDQAYADLQEVLDASTRAAALTRQLLAFSRRQSLTPQVLDPSALVARTERLLQRLIGEDIRLRVVAPAGLGHIRADPGQIEQILVNLAVNARDAMPTGGMLDIVLRECDAGAARPAAALQPGRYIEIAVTDTGFGMTEETVSHIFEPFFTTKGEGQGTGLGLATVYGIVQQNGGGIDVDSAFARGTTFRVYLPVVEGALEQSAEVARKAARGHETLLLVEDDAAVRALFARTLGAWGYVVMPASNGEDALQIIRSHGRAIHLMITDVVLPGISGKVLAERAAELMPHARVLFISGHGGEALRRHGVAQDDVAFLQKPFAMEALGEKVREILDRA